MPFYYSSTERDKQFEILHDRQVKLIEGYCFADQELHMKALFHLHYEEVDTRKVPKKIRQELLKEYHEWVKHKV